MVMAMAAAGDAGSVWTSLEIAKLVVVVVVVVAAPVAVTVLGVFIARGRGGWRRCSRPTRPWSSTGGVRPGGGPIEAVVVFATFVGRWKDITALDALTLKRQVDEEMYAHRPLFSAELFGAYEGSMGCLLRCTRRSTATP